MSDDWRKPLPPLLGPVATESWQRSTAENERIVYAGAVAAHVAAGHDGPIESCDRGCCDPVPRPVMRLDPQKGKR